MQQNGFTGDTRIRNKAKQNHMDDTGLGQGEVVRNTRAVRCL